MASHSTSDKFHRYPVAVHIDQRHAARVWLARNCPDNYVIHLSLDVDRSWVYGIRRSGRMEVTFNNAEDAMMFSMIFA